MTETNGKVKLYLSRSTYPVNSPVIGTINVSSDINLSSLQIYIAGRSRLDARWHDIKAIKSRYGTHPCHDELPSWVEQCAEESCFNDNQNRTVNNTGPAPPPSPTSRKKKESICFWSTNVLSLWRISSDSDSGTNGIQVPFVDNNEDEMEEDKPTPLVMSGSEWFNRASEFLEKVQAADEDLEYENQPDPESDSDDNSEVISSLDDSANYEHYGDSPGLGSGNNGDIGGDIGDGISLHGETEDEPDSRDRQDCPLHFTFRTNLPADIVPTVNAVCARYYYSAVVYGRTVDGNSIVVQAPFTVVTPTKQAYAGALENSVSTKAKIRIGSIVALAHARPYLVPLSVTYKVEPWSISVKHTRSQGTLARSNQKSIAIEEGGYKCGNLTISGGGIISPGETISLHFVSADDSVDNDSVLPCYQVSACLRGEEHAIGLNGVKKKCRSYIFDTDFERFNFGATESASLSLKLPVHCPITLSTDFVEINVNCRIDFTVKTPGSNSYRFLTVQFPCKIVHPAQEEEQNEYELTPALENKLMDLKWAEEKYMVHKKMFSSEALNDLNMLSLHLLKI